MRKLRTLARKKDTRAEKERWFTGFYVAKEMAISTCQDRPAGPSRELGRASVQRPLAQGFSRICCGGLLLGFERPFVRIRFWEAECSTIPCPRRSRHLRAAGQPSHPQPQARTRHYHVFLVDWAVILQGGTPFNPAGDFGTTLDELFSQEGQGLQVACAILKQDRLFQVRVCEALPTQSDTLLAQTYRR